ncbi:MAG: phosphoribosylamine--glycine ligase [Thermaurantimonas sp.]
MKKILLIGSGGREYTMAWKISQSPIAHKLFIAPGNGGTDAFGQNIPIDVHDFEGIRQFAVSEQIDLVIVGPEEPLVNGLADLLEEIGIAVCGPRKAGAMLEGSKAFAKEFMMEFGIPTASYRSFSASEINQAREYLRCLKPPYVIKADGLAAGKGVIITDKLDEAERALNSIVVDNKFGKSGSRVVIEEFLKGIEFSVFVATDGTHYALLPEAKDYKRIGEGDTGLNTGGMGAVSPVPFFSDDLRSKVIRQIIEPTLYGLKKREILYRGFIFFGLILVDDQVYVIEYNCRLGDPETEVILPRIESDFLELCLAVADRTLSDIIPVHVTPQASSTVMLVSAGYPELYKKGFEIQIHEDLPEHVLVVHAGTIKKNKKLITNGGRVISVTAMAPQLSQAIDRSYEAISKISFEGMYYRRDIGHEFLK